MIELISYVHIKDFGNAYLDAEISSQNIHDPELPINTEAIEYRRKLAFPMNSAEIEGKKKLSLKSWAFAFLTQKT
jgi:hypothetical protein